MKKVLVLVLVLLMVGGYIPQAMGMDYVGIPGSLWGGHLKVGNWACMSEQATALARSQNGDDFYIFNFEESKKGKYQFFKLPLYTGGCGWVEFQTKDAKIFWLTWDAMKERAEQILSPSSYKVFVGAVDNYLGE